MSKPSEKCANCATERFAVYRSGYCRRCYRLIIQKREVEHWNLDKPSTLRGLSKGGFVHTGDDPRFVFGYGRKHLEQELPKYKRNRLKELDARLFLLKTHEAQRNQPVDGLQIANALRDLAEWSRGNKDVVYNIASEVTEYFSPEARRVSLGWLIDIEESARWDPRRYWHLVDPEY
jgi:hypothetical protein